ncbi:unnamed protein product [Paramecium pentaurelia]|uniref:Uncharacterized protein n=1 Tax=Paramecium pentaurelia TaxID=43138 RepID=A0A8S1UZH5_9CILI|nr:unnamed protein product [Paramecium pentaurelia]
MDFDFKSKNIEYFQIMTHQGLICSNLDIYKDFQILILNQMNIIEESEQKSSKSVQQNKQAQKKELRPRSNIVPGIFQEYKRTYVKVPPVSKDQLSRLVLKEGFKIKEAAKKLSIKYATAKTIIFHLREEKKQIIQVGSKMCSYTELQSGMISKLRVISTASNDIISNVEYQLVPQNQSQIQ